MDGAYGSLLVFSSVCAAVAGQYLSSGGSSKQPVYVTSKAAGKLEDLWCYSCESMDVDDHCVDLLGNHTSMIRKCPDGERICSVKRITYTTTTENGTTVSKMWSLTRNCSHRCESGCIVVGERTKLHACTACCETSLCNVMTGAAGPAAPLAPALLLWLRLLPPLLLARAPGLAAAVL